MTTDCPRIDLARLRILEAMVRDEIDEDHAVYLSHRLGDGKILPHEIILSAPGNWCSMVRA